MDLSPEAYDELVWSGVHQGKLRAREHQLVSRLARLVGVPEGVERIASDIISTYKSSRGGGVNASICVASLILASRIQGFSIPIDLVLSEASVRVKPRTLFRALSELKSMTQERGICWESYLNYVLKRVISGNGLIPKNDETRYLLEERLRVNAKKEIVRIVREKRGEILGKNPMHVAALATYLAAKRCGLRLPLSRIASCVGASRVSLYRILRVIRDGRRSLF